MTKVRCSFCYEQTAYNTGMKGEVGSVRKLLQELQ